MTTTNSYKQIAPNGANARSDSDSAFVLLPAFRQQKKMKSPDTFHRPFALCNEQDKTTNF
jgi:hypothetical protein